MSLCFSLVWCGCTVSDRAARTSTPPEIRLLGSKISQKNTAWAAIMPVVSDSKGGWLPGEGMRASLDGLRHTRYEVHYEPFLASLAEVLAAAGHLDESLAAVDEALARCRLAATHSGGCPKLLRVKGEVFAVVGEYDCGSRPFPPDPSIRRIARALLSWELRAAMSLGRLDHAQGRLRETRHRLGSVYGRSGGGVRDARPSGRETASRRVDSRKAHNGKSGCSSWTRTGC